MPTTTLRSRVTVNGKQQNIAQVVNVTHNNARLYYHTDGQTYEFEGLDVSSNRIYKDARPPLRINERP